MFGLGRVWVMLTASMVLASVVLAPIQGKMAKGFVFEDLNKNGVKDSGEPGIGGVMVSDQFTVVKTRGDGSWNIPLRGDDLTFFVTKPRGYMTPVNEDQLPQFYYSHKPAGSKSLRYGGVEPTGPLPDSIDFPLTKQEEPDQFEALFFGDTQPRNVKEVEYIRRDIIEPLIGKHKASFGVTLGDLVFDDLDVFGPYNKTIALLGIPWYNVIGNHDINFDAKKDQDSDETFERVYGPNYYSFDHGPVHFVVLDNVHWEWPEDAQRGRYTGKFGEDQLAWVKQDLSMIPDDKLVILSMHIPLVGTSDREALYRLIEKRPYVMSVAAHTHFQQHHFLDEKDGWHGKEPHHHLVNVTTSGSWWSGKGDEFGIPHTTMRDGAPNGYSIFRFDGNQYEIEFRAARREKSYQIEIHAPHELTADSEKEFAIYANVFGGSEKSKVEIKIGDGEWMVMEKTNEQDPGFVAMRAAEGTPEKPYRPLPGPVNSSHLWKVPFNSAGKKGMIPVHVRTTDMFGQKYIATKGILVR